MPASLFAILFYLALKVIKRCKGEHYQPFPLNRIVCMPGLLNSL